jgi:phytanoyl-CoA hydroxylase
MPTTHAYPTITDNDIAFFRESGFLAVPGALSIEEIKELRKDATQICRGDYGDYHGFVPTEAGDREDDILKRFLCIHFPHKISQVMFKYLGHPVIGDVLTKAIGPNVKCMQSMLFIKAAGKPGQAWHQDEVYIPTRDRSLTGAWIALDDATVENGTLWVIPGSHKHGILWPQHEHDDRRFDCAEETFGFPYSEKDEIPVEVEAGTILFFNGYLLHRSQPNRAAAGYRRVLVNHYMSAESLLPWGRVEEGRHFANTDNRDIVLIAGIDPYAYKGIEDKHKAHVRATGEGGCKPNPKSEK